MTASNNASGCLAILAIAFGLAFWQVTIVLICIAVAVATVGYLQGQVNLAEANRWLSSHRSWPCIYSGQYGFVDGVSVEGKKITLSIKPVRALLPSPSAPFISALLISAFDQCL